MTNIKFKIDDFEDFKTGRYQVMWVDSFRLGKPHWSCVYCDTKEDAERVAREEGKYDNLYSTIIRRMLTEEDRVRMREAGI